MERYYCSNCLDLFSLPSGNSSLGEIRGRSFWVMGSKAMTAMSDPGVSASSTQIQAPRLPAQAPREEDGASCPRRRRRPSAERPFAMATNPGTTVAFSSV